VHAHAGGTEVVAGERIAEWHHGHHGRPGHHHHKHPELDDPFVDYQRGTAFLVGMLHGIGAETPTQILIFTAAAGAGGEAAGVATLVAFLVGLMSSNSLITVGSAFGFLQASKNFTLYATVAVITGVFSLVLGVLFLLGKESVLPAFFAG
jgi:cytochrome c biogenesis protein CcdA